MDSITTLSELLNTVIFHQLYQIGSKQRLYISAEGLVYDQVLKDKSGLRANKQKELDKHEVQCEKRKCI